MNVEVSKRRLVGAGLLALTLALALVGGTASAYHAACGGDPGMINLTNGNGFNGVGTSSTTNSVSVCYSVLGTVPCGSGSNCGAVTVTTSDQNPASAGSRVRVTGGQTQAGPVDSGYQGAEGGVVGGSFIVPTCLYGTTLYGPVPIGPSNVGVC